jgi:hypothetical protein
MPTPIGRPSPTGPIDAITDAETSPHTAGSADGGADAAAPLSPATGTGRADVLAALTSGFVEPKAAGEEAEATGSLPGLPEHFPLTDLSDLEATGRAGQAFLLDSGALEGLLLRARRLETGDGPGFELIARLSPARRDALRKRLEDLGAASSPLAFRAAELNDGGVARLTGTPVEIRDDGSGYAPEDIDDRSDTWVSALETPEGARLELVEDDAALAARGLLRIRLTGSDAEATSALGALVASAGLEDLFAAPTDEAKLRQVLLQALWQVDHKRAGKLAASGLDAVDIDTLEAALRKAGFDDDRIGGLRRKEVFPGYASVVDPTTLTELKAAGARYVYHSAMRPEHVGVMLEHGIKSSLRRYSEGLIIDGMSTSEDFNTGGAVGAFTRLVTEKKLMSDDRGTADGTDYYLVMRPEILARADWYGHAEDRYGRLWDLSTKENFGEGLVDAIDEQDWGGDDNELIFREGIAPADILHVAARSPRARQDLLKQLREQGYVPPDGRSLEEMVVVAPELERIEPPPYDLSDLEAFAEGALKKARRGKTHELAWFLADGPTADGVRADMERRVLRSSKPELREVLMKALRSGGRFAGAPGDVAPRLLKIAGSDKADDRDRWEELRRSGIEAMLTLNDEALFQRLQEDPETGSRLSDLAYNRPERAVELLAQLLAQGGGAADSPATVLALEHLLPPLLRHRDVDLGDILRKHPELLPPRTPTWLREELGRIEQGESPTKLQLLLVSAETPEDVAWAEQILLGSAEHQAQAALMAHVRRHGRLGLSAEALLDALKDAGPGAPGPRELLQNREAVKDLLARGDEDLMRYCLRHAGGQLSWVLHAEDWAELVTRTTAEGSKTPASLQREVLLRAVESGALYHDPKPGSQDAVYEALSRLTLFEVRDPKHTATVSAKKLQDEDAAEAKLKLAWLLAQPDLSDDDRAGVTQRLLVHGSWTGRELLDWAIHNRGESGIAAAELPELLRELRKVEGYESEEALRWVSGHLGKELLLSGSADTLKQLKAVVKEHDWYTLALSEDDMLEALEELAERGDPTSRDTASWLLEGRARELLRARPKAFAAAVGALQLGPADLGWASPDHVRELLDEHVREVEWDSQVTPRTQAALRWVLSGPDGAPDATRVTGLLDALPDWFSHSRSTAEEMLKALSFLEPAHADRLAELRKHAETLAYG